MVRLHHLTYPTSSLKKNAVVVAHGLMGNAYNWNSLCTTFSKHAGVEPFVGSIMALDMRNHGNSEHSAKHSCALMATDIERFILDEVITPHNEHSVDAFPERSVVVGHSMGGIAMMHSLVRQANAERYLHAEDESWSSFNEQNVKECMSVVNGQECYDHSSSTSKVGQVGGAVIVDVAPMSRSLSTFKQIRHDLGALLELPLESIKSVSEASALLKDLGVDNAQMRNFLLTNMKFNRNASTGANQAVLKSNVAVLRRDLDLITFPDTPESAIKKVDLPVKFVFGGDSPYLNDEARANIGKYFSNYTIDVIEGAGHFVHHEKPRDFVETVAPFIGSSAL